MRRIACWLAVASIVSVATGQVWERPLAPGLMYRMETDLSGPRNIHALRWSPQSGQVIALPTLGNGTVFSAELGKSRATVARMVEQERAIAGVNADFFPWTGDPLGFMVRHDELVSTPYEGRSFFAWGPTASAIGKGTFEGQFSIGSTRIKLAGINQECGPEEAVLYTEIAGYAKAKEDSLTFVLMPEQSKLRPTSVTRTTIESVIPTTRSLAIPKGRWVLVVSGKRADALKSSRVGARCIIDVETNPYDDKVLDFAVAGGPNLITKGEVNIDAVGQKFGEKFSTTRHPRTAVGTTPEGDVWWVVVDGRQDLSVGASLDEMAAIMLRYGCTNAINLDGGGSSVLHVRGVALNRPSDGFEREVANGVVFVGPFSDRRPGDRFSVVAPTTLKVGESAQLVIKLNDVGLQQVEVLWSSMGGGWIDQSGLLKAQKPGVATVRALVRGAVVEHVVTIVEK